jgi:phospholipid/cholesterol/gamma-HCH transport system substrate-binding protein
MNRSTIDLWVGIFVVIGIGAIAFLSLKVGNLTSVRTAPGYHLAAAFDNIGGLKLRAPVKAAGVVVGRVEKIMLDPQSYQALVTMRIDQGYQFSKDTIASILTSGLLGEVYIGLDSGGDTQMLADNARIGKTQSAMVLEKLIGQFMFDKAAGPSPGASHAPQTSPATGSSQPATTPSAAGSSQPVTPSAAMAGVPK